VIFTVGLALVVVAFGAAVQGAVGFGAALIAAPLLALLQPDFVPAPVIITALALNVLIVSRERGHARWTDAAWPIVGLLPGAILGAAVLDAAGGRALEALFGVLVLLAVALSASGVRPRATSRVLFGAGTLAGFMQSTVGAGGPPVALTLPHDDLPAYRATLARFFIVSCAVSLTVLAAFGQLHADDVGYSLLLVPGTVAGFALSGWTARHVDARRARVVVLVLSASAAAALLVRALL
jgi:uncharacterized membrane protein YfcA